MDQLDPFQWSTDAEFPTAAQLSGVGHDTPVRPAKPPTPAKEAGRTGLATIDQRDPFSCSTNSLFGVAAEVVA